MATATWSSVCLPPTAVPSAGSVVSLVAAAAAAVVVVVVAATTTTTTTSAAVVVVFVVVVFGCSTLLACRKSRDDSIGLAVPRREYALANTLPVQL